MQDGFESETRALHRSNCPAQRRAHHDGRATPETCAAAHARNGSGFVLQITIVNMAKSGQALLAVSFASYLASCAHLHRRADNGPVEPARTRPFAAQRPPSQHPFFFLP